MIYLGSIDALWSGQPATVLEQSRPSGRLTEDEQPATIVGCDIGTATVTVRDDRTGALRVFVGRRSGAMLDYADKKQSGPGFVWVFRERVKGQETPWNFLDIGSRRHRTGGFQIKDCSCPACAGAAGDHRADH